MAPDGVGGGWIADVVLPWRNGQLAADQSGLALVESLRSRIDPVQTQHQGHRMLWRIKAKAHGVTGGSAGAG